MRSKTSPFPCLLRGSTLDTTSAQLRHWRRRRSILSLDVSLGSGLTHQVRGQAISVALWPIRTRCADMMISAECLRAIASAPRLRRSAVRGAERAREQQTKNDGTEEEGVPGQKSGLVRNQKLSLSEGRPLSRSFCRLTVVPCALFATCRKTGATRSNESRFARSLGGHTGL